MFGWVQQPAAPAEGFEELMSTSMLVDGTWWGAMRALDTGESLSGASCAALPCRSDGTLAWLMPPLAEVDASPSLTVPWIHFWKSLRYARADWMMQARRPAPLYLYSRLGRRCALVGGREAG